MSIRRTKDQKGYTLLFAVLVSALVLGVAVFILSLSTKQAQLSSAARNSVYSFYAADTGLECADAAYMSVNGSDHIATDITGVSITCNGVNKSLNGPAFVHASLGYPAFLQSDTVQQTPSGNLDFPLQNPGNPSAPPCVRIVVYDGYDGPGSTGNHYTVMDARGYNDCTGGAPDTTNPSTVERALRLTKKG